jgi:hypothetical protein
VRWLFGIYADRKAYYESVPTTFNYRYNTAEGLLGFYDRGRINPWNVLPGKWLFFSDYSAGFGSYGTPNRSDLRSLFIEQADYTAPFGLQLTGGRTDRFPQKLARAGLGGL